MLTQLKSIIFNHLLKCHILNTPTYLPHEVMVTMVTTTHRAVLWNTSKGSMEDQVTHMCVLYLQHFTMTEVMHANPLVV